MRVLYFDCFSGAAGDMILGALVDAGASETAVRDVLGALDIHGWELQLGPVNRGGLRATKASVSVPDDEPARTYRSIVDLIESVTLPELVAERALAIFRALAEAEATVHGVPLDDVHLHEAGALDAIVDVVGVSAALVDLAPELIITSPITTGRGMIDSADGPLPIPAPAVTRLLEGAPIVERGTKELVTPTGAAILAAMTNRFGPMPEMTLRNAGYGAGTRDLDVPNVVRVLVGDIAGERSERSALLIECNLDDMSPELVPYVIERLMGAGAQDAWSEPIAMKKGRPAIKLSALTTRSDMDPILDVLFTETTTLGVRMAPVGKRELERAIATVEVAGYEVGVKVGMMDGRLTTVSPEYEDALKVARLTGMPLKEIYRLAIEAYRA